ncbi:MAG: DNA internalization-related competence protein ComEC/Rec2 [Deltaproteobacteria bacterium]|nr:DNA internalization-related competence protein ComEC/Rec2 [Deltaproteobacteria bacterium]
MRPLVWIVISFCLGLLGSSYLKPGYEVILPFILFSFIPIIAASFRNSRIRPPFYLPLFFFTGALFILPMVRPAPGGNNIKNFIRHKTLQRVEGVVEGVAEADADAVRVYVDAKRVFTDGFWQDTEGKVIINAEGRPDVRSGDMVWFMSSLKEPRNFNDSGEFDYEWWSRTRGIDARGNVKRGLLVRVEEGRGFFNLIDGIRGGVREFIDSSGFETGAIIKALVIGEKGSIADETREAFIRSGTAHILAISGLHVGFVAYLSYLFFFWIFRRSERLLLAVNVKKLAWFMSFFPVFSYGLISGFSVSTQRAVIMAGVLVLTVLIGRLREIYSAVAFAALLILAREPGALWDVSFQLSFAAVISIIYLVPRMNSLWPSSLPQGQDKTPVNRIRKLVNGMKMLFLISVAAGLGTYPPLAYHFHRVSLAGFIANMFVVPITGFIILPLALISVLAAMFWKGLAIFLIGAADTFLYPVVWIVKFLSGLPYSSLWVARPTILEIIIFYSIILCAPMVRKRRAALFLLVSLGSLFFLERGWLYYEGPLRDGLKVTFVSVGQGDAALVLFPASGLSRGKRMLIDGGGSLGAGFDAGEGIIAPMLWKERIKKVDYIVLTHPQRDHMEGLKFIAENFSPEEFWWSGIGELPPRLRDVLREKGVEVRTIGSESPATVIDDVRVDFLNPPNAYRDEGLEINNSSLVLKLTYGKRRFLFTGDIKEKAEGLLMGRDIRADVLKVPHHGSRFSSTPSFIDKVNPEVAVISTGWMNNFGFPHGETLKRYGEKGITLYRTDMDGAVTVETDGESLDVKTYLTGTQ